MFCDVRSMHGDDVPVMWSKVRRFLRSADITCDRDDNEYFMTVRGTFWKFDSHARGFRINEDGSLNWENAVVFMSYYPPNGGRVRFDSHVYAKGGQSWLRQEVDQSIVKQPTYWSVCPDMVREYGEALVKYGHMGKNRLSYFEPVSVKMAWPPKQQAGFLNLKSLWESWKAWRAK